ncbi:major facilitator superfamily domain-containing protein [Irpex rosettiformis]|uniref:Major facilitator superfamily domain-containing protein n=1 Tax=Irpex rosettiformis TaxID=378272 RepID=A0ACB8UI22_9APHY|nr:major facilitator superfamily domain-containing protein [Irpex rosettiformis]
MTCPHKTTPTERTALLHTAVTTAKACSETRHRHNEFDDRALVGPLDLPRSTRYGILLGVWIANFLSALNTTLVATLLSSISSDFDKSHQASWLGTAYLLATCTFTPLYGRLCNVMGRRAANQTAVIFAALGTTACGLANSMEMLVAARFLTGIGGGGVFTTASIITCDMYSMRARGITQGVASVFESLGMGLGGPFGGYISDRFGWRWAFLFQLPLFALSLMLTSINLHYATPGRGGNTKEILKRIDYGGSSTLLLSVLSFLFFLTTKYSNEQPWNSPYVFVPLALAVLSLFLFLLVEFRFSIEPVFPPHIAMQRVPFLVGTASFMVSMCNFAIMYNLPTFFQTVLLTSASEAGAHLIPNGVSLSMGSLFAGWWMHRTGRYRTLTLVCGLLPFISTLMIASMKENSHPLLLWLGIFPLGFGNAVVLQTMLIALLAHLPVSALAEATGFSQFWRSVGQVAGVGLSSAMFQSTLNTALHQRISGPGSERIIEKIRRSATLVAQLPPNLQRAARDSYAAGLHVVFVAAACSTFIAYCIRFPVPDKNLSDEPASPPPPSSIHTHHPKPKHVKVSIIDSDDESFSSPSQSFPHTPLLDGDISEASDFRGCKPDSGWNSGDEDDEMVYIDIAPQMTRRRQSSPYESRTQGRGSAEMAIDSEVRERGGEASICPESHMRSAGEERSNGV